MIASRSQRSCPGRSGGRLAARYAHGAEIDQPLQLETFSPTGEPAGRFTYHADQLGSVRFLTDDLGNVVNSRLRRA